MGRKNVATKRTGKRERAKVRPEASDETPLDQGSFALGFIGGLLGGCVVVALILRRGKTMTRNGVFFGFALQIIIAFVVSR